MSTDPRLWSDEDIDEIKRWWGSKTAREIGEGIGKTKNSVIGKARRLGLPPQNHSPTGQPGQRRRAPHPKPSRPSKALPFHRRGRQEVTPVAPPKSIPGGVHIVDLESHHCREVIGNGTDGLARYCGDSRVIKWLTNFDGSPFLDRDGRPMAKMTPYCEAHYRINYRQFPSGN